MTLYLDSSSIVKLYVEEPGSGDVAALVGAASVVATSAIAYPEVRAALARKRRERSLTPRELRLVRDQFDADWVTMLTLAVTDALARRAGELADAHGLRGADALHLAAFERVVASDTTSDIVRFSSADERLNRAARRLG